MKRQLQKSKDRLPLKTKLGYGVGAIGLDMSYGLVTSFFMNYATDVLLISSVFMGVMMAFARVWDGINDPLMGVIVTNTKSKYGRFRPWILAGAVLNAVVLFAMFTNPGFTIVKGGTETGLYIYIAVAYILWGTSYTLIDLPYWSFIPALTSDPQERNVIASIPRFFSGLGQLTVMGATPLILKAFSDVEQGTVFSRWALVMGVLFIIVAVITVVSTKERIVPKQEKALKFREVISTIRANDQLLVFFAVAVAFNLGWYLMNGLAMYFFKYVTENELHLTIFAAVSGAGQAIGLFGLSFLAKRMSKHKVVKLSILVTIAGYLAMFFVSQTPDFSLVLFFAFHFVACLGIGCMFTAEASMLADIVDYGEYKTGVRSDAVTFSVKSFQMQFAQTIQALIIGFGLWLFRYEENVFPQPDLSKLGINVMMFLIPPALALLSLIVFNRKYKIHSKLYEDICDAMQNRC
ncbi:MAG: glycoside-pentoside-hexuronide (GPH):cation symporter [Oscillospiraceae bacterium]|jgi:melibiose permease|nr:glycoside-pentoside-hexuronide (GPH):cation symporter [Oscillospiraceae bacterium]